MTECIFSTNKICMIHFPEWLEIHNSIDVVDSVRCKYRFPIGPMAHPVITLPKRSSPPSFLTQAQRAALFSLSQDLNCAQFPLSHELFSINKGEYLKIIFSTALNYYVLTIIYTLNFLYSTVRPKILRC